MHRDKDGCTIYTVARCVAQKKYGNVSHMETLRGIASSHQFLACQPPSTSLYIFHSFVQSIYVSNSSQWNVLFESTLPLAPFIIANQLVLKCAKPTKSHSQQTRKAELDTREYRYETERMELCSQGDPTDDS